MEDGLQCLYILHRRRCHVYVRHRHYEIFIPVIDPDRQLSARGSSHVLMPLGLDLDTNVRTCIIGPE